MGLGLLTWFWKDSLAWVRDVMISHFPALIILLRCNPSNARGMFYAACKQQTSDVQEHSTVQKVGVRVRVQNVLETVQVPNCPLSG
jgi:hypothetical protein